LHIFNKNNLKNNDVESSRTQAEEIAKLTGKQVICVETDEFFVNKNDNNATN